MIEDILSSLGASDALNSAERLACQQALSRLETLASEVSHLRPAEKHLKAFAVAIAEGGTGAAREARDLLEDLYAEYRSSGAAPC